MYARRRAVVNTQTHVLVGSSSAILETGEIQRVGVDRAEPQRVDVRVIAATNRHLLDRIASGEFRKDLYYRLNVIHIPIPPLRERREDIPELLQHFLQLHAERDGVR